MFPTLEKTISLKPEVLEGLGPSVNKYQDTGILITCESPLQYSNLAC